MLEDVERGEAAPPLLSWSCLLCVSMSGTSSPTVRPFVCVLIARARPACCPVVRFAAMCAVRRVRASVKVCMSPLLLSVYLI